MALGLSFGSQKSKSSSNPWAKQIPFLTQGFESAQNLLNSADQSFQGIADLLGQYGNQLLPQLGQVGEFAQGLLNAPGGENFNPFAKGHDAYNQITQDYFTPADQMAADRMQADLMENFRRSDAGDAMGASLAGVGVGDRSSEYLQARALGLGETQNAISRGLVGLHQGALGRATDRANQYANTFMQNQGNAMDALWQGGQMGASMLPGSWQFAQDATWNPLQNYWNIVGSNSWGGTTKGKGSSMGMNFASGGK